jgi:hypothetical protein
MNPIPDSVKTLIRERLKAKLARERAQRQLISDDNIFWETIRAKLEPINDTNQFWNFSRCGGDEVHFDCKSCGLHHQFLYRCSLRWCPRCSWKISEERKGILKLWAEKIKQPKHLVLTMKNFPVLTKREIRFFKKSLIRLRHWKIFRQVRGGCCSVEFTNEGNGWHMHAHLLLDVRYLDMAIISKKWAKVLGQKFAIVQIKDCRDRDYIKEISKYVVEGSEMAKWPAEKINEFVRAIVGHRFFTSFGELRKLAPLIRSQLAFAAREKFACECGSRSFKFGGSAAKGSAQENEVLAAFSHPHVFGESVAQSRLNDSLDKEFHNPLLPHI